MIFVSSRKANPLGCLLGVVLGMVVLFYLIRGVWYLLYWAAPVLVVLAVIINWNAVADTGRRYANLLRTNPLVGIAVLVIAFFAFPFLALYLFLKAVGNRRIEKMETEYAARKAPEEELADFEELETRLKTPPPPPPEPLRPEEKPREQNPYDAFFNE